MLILYKQEPVWDHRTVWVIQSLDEPIETLFPFSEYYKVGREFFLLAVKGILKPAFDLTKLRSKLAQKLIMTKTNRMRIRKEKLITRGRGRTCDLSLRRRTL